MEYSHSPVPWGEYIDTELITQFEEETGIRVNYQTVESNETLYSLLKSGGADYDVVVPSDYMIAKLIEEGMLEEPSIFWNTSSITFPWNTPRWLASSIN